MEGDNVANPEHLAILNRGVKAWNEWRTKNIFKQAAYCTQNWLDLRGIHLLDTNFVGAILDDVDLTDSRLAHVDFRGSSFSDSLLEKADLRDADLSHTDLHRANLTGANLEDARLVGADLHGACLNGVILKDADLTGADLKNVSLQGAKLARACISDADVRACNLDNADCTGANFAGAKLTEASLRHANLHRASLPNADLRKTDLRYCILTCSDLSGAMLTGARLYATARDGWIITKLKCRYVYWDAKGKIPSPKSRRLIPGEFERLEQALPTIEYVFENGMTPLDPLIMDRVVQAIRDQNPEFDIKIDSLSARGLVPSVTFTVREEEHKEPALRMVVVEYKRRVKQLEAEKDHLYNLLSRAIDKAGTRLIEAGPGAVVATDNAVIHSVDMSTNLVDLKADELFEKTREMIRDLVEDKALSRELLQKVEEMQQTKGTKTFREKYREFLALAADYMGVLSPIVPALARMLGVGGG